VSQPYDVIVVGAGSGGGVVAARLTEDPGLRVLLLEAGPDLGGDVPDAVAHLRLGSGVPELDWDWTEPASGSALPRGRLVGGSSAVNATVALRGQPQDYDAWEAQGAVGWGWRDVLPYFRRLEDDVDFGDRPWHGRGGPIQVMRELPLRPNEELFLAACEELGHDRVADQNEPGRVGAGPLPRNLKDGRRQSTLLTYLAAARARPNLTLRADTPVDRVRLRGGRATGVVLAGGETVAARRVVLCAGAYASPALLLRSGIGPRADLAGLGIGCAVDLPGVGANLMDHPVTMVTLDMDNPTDPDRIRMAVTCKTRSDPALEVDDLKISLYPGDLFNMRGLSGLYVEVNVSDSRGRVTIAGADPAAAPVIEHRFLSDARDLDRLVVGVRQAVAIHDVMARSIRSEILLPDAETIADDRLLRDHLRQFHSTGYHPSGTCRMGAADDAGAVVDPSLRVRGVEGLQVADASVMPLVPRCNINLPTLMIGERAAELVREGL
jgi:choline dehydrogenase